MAKRTRTIKVPAKRRRLPKIIRLNIGCGDVKIKGFTNIDRKSGEEAYPLKYPDNSVDEIRASHILEHFGHRQTAEVLTDWIRALKPSGRLRVAVPNFDYIVDGYQKGSDEPLEGFLMGGHVDADDRHGAIFNKQKLIALFKTLNLRHVKEWKDDVKDCAALPVSLNIEGYKHKSDEPEIPQPIGQRMNVHACMSMPRLCFTDNFFSCYQALLPHRVKLKKYTGAFWGQCLTRCMEEVISEGAQVILTIDYDTVFTIDDVEGILELLEQHPEADAICAMQSARSRDLPLFTVVNAKGQKVSEVEVSRLQKDLLQVHTAHFGLTAIRVKSLLEIEKPWFFAKADKDGAWNDDKTDEDIWFWKQWEKAKKTLFMANRFPVGHMELMIRWPSKNLEVTYQHPNEWCSGKTLEGRWK